MNVKTLNFRPILYLLFTVIGGQESKELARKIASKLDCKYIDSKVTMFPDGESKITIPETPTGTVVVVQTTYPHADTNMMRALALIAKAKKTASHVIAVIPYLCYMRQDMEFLSGEIVTSKIVAKLLGATGAAKIITVDIHSNLAVNYFDVPLMNTSAVPKMAGYFIKLDLKSPMIISPDLFWSKKAKQFAEILGAEQIALNKQRDRKTGKLKILHQKNLDLSGRDVVLIDDMISTGNSMILAARYAKSCYCRRIFAVCTHPLLVDNAEKRLMDADIDKIISSNTIEHKTNQVDVSDIIAQSIE